MNYLSKFSKSIAQFIKKSRTIEIGDFYIIRSGERRANFFVVVHSTLVKNTFAVLVLPTMEALYLSQSQFKKHIKQNEIDYVGIFPAEMVEPLFKEFMFQISKDHGFDLTLPNDPTEPIK